MNDKPAAPASGSPSAPDNVGRWILITTILASSMAFIDSSALNVALPSLQADLGAGGAELLWIVNGYLLMLSALILIGGSLGDKRGRKRVFMFGIGLFMAGSLACGLAPSTGFLIAARVVQGIGGALMIPGSLSIIAAWFDTGSRGRAIGTWSAVTTLVTIGGPILGGFLAGAGLWRAIFLINIPLGVAALIGLALKVPESHDETASATIDYLGAAVIALGLAGLTYGFVAAPDLGFRDLRVSGALAGGVVALLAFGWIEAHSDHPMVPLDIFRSRTFSGANLLTLFLYGALNAGFLFLPRNLIQVQGYGQAVAGLALTPVALILTLLSRWAGGLVDRYGPRPPLIVGPLLAGTGFLLLALVGLTDGPAQYWTTFLPGLIVFGVGLGVTVAPLTTAVMGAAAAERAGTASGINNAVARTAGVLAIAIIGAVTLTLFAGSLDRRTATVDLTPAARVALRGQAGQLGAAVVPPQVAAGQVADVARAIRLAFVDTFRAAMLMCAGLAWLSALMAARWISPRPATLRTGATGP